MLRGINEMLGIGWQPHQLAHVFVNDVLNAGCDRELMIVITSHILESA
jgi:hypothetical protein